MREIYKGKRLDDGTEIVGDCCVVTSHVAKIGIMKEIPQDGWISHEIDWYQIEPESARIIEDGDNS